VRNNRGDIEKVVIVSRDITERKQAEELLRGRDEQLRQAQKMEAVGRLSGGIAHDFNNLLGVIIGYSESIEYRLAANDPLRKSAEEIRKAGERAASLTHQLLAFSRQRVLQTQILDLNALVTDMGTMLKRLIGMHIELTTKLGTDLGQVKAEQSQIEQVIVNLVVNARDAMPDGGKLVIETSNLDVNENLASSFSFLHYQGAWKRNRLGARYRLRRGEADGRRCDCRFRTRKRVNIQNFSAANTRVRHGARSQRDDSKWIDGDRHDPSGGG
jgi:signal transduction histidine kinase